MNAQELAYNDYSAMIMAYTLGKDCTAYALALKLQADGTLDEARMVDVRLVIERLAPKESV